MLKRLFPNLAECDFIELALLPLAVVVLCFLIVAPFTERAIG